MNHRTEDATEVDVDAGLAIFDEGPHKRHPLVLIKRLPLIKKGGDAGSREIGVANQVRPIRLVT
jgi:hypothetical protein